MSTPPPSPTAADAEQAPTRREWGALAVLSLGLGLIVLDGTIVGVALPDIIADLGLDLTDAQWVNSLYAVLLAALLLSTGRLADRWGRKRLFLAGIVIFAGGSLLAALAGSAARFAFRSYPLAPADRPARARPVFYPCRSALVAVT